MDKLQTINRALMKCGLPLAASLADCDWNAAMIFDDVAVELLRCHPWGFAQTFATLTRSATNPAHGFNYAYTLPADCVRVIDVHGEQDLRAPNARFVTTGKQIFTNVSPCNIRYVRKLVDPEQWPLDFGDAVANRIAAEIAGLSAENMGLVAQLLSVANIFLEQARLNDARESSERISLNDSIFAGRTSDNGR